jgi:NADPH-dependent ferric siderophore reductase
MPGSLTSTAEIALAEPGEVMRRLCAHFAEHGKVHVEGRCARIDTGFGIAALESCERCLKVLAHGHDGTALAYVKLAIAEHLLHLAAPQEPRIVWQGDGMAGTPLPYFREMRVARAVAVTRSMRRLTLAGSDLGRFATGGLHVRLLFPKDRNSAPTWPVTGEDGRPQWPGQQPRPDIRIYTIRRIDVERGEVDIDFVLHEGAQMPGARFAQEARVGDRVGMTGPGGGTVGDADWYLLAGDDTALPAIGRILEQMPAGKHAVVRIEVAGAEDEQPLPSAAAVDLQWLHRGAAEPGTTSLLETAVRNVAWPSAGTRVFAWAGCEYTSFRAIRGFLRNTRGLSLDKHLVAAYWRSGSSAEGVK